MATLTETLVMTKTTFLLWREAAKLTQGQAATVLGITQQAVSKLDLGRQKPSTDTRLLMRAYAEGFRGLRPWPE